MLLENYTGDSKVLKAIAHILNRKAPLPLDGGGDADFGTNGQVLTTDGSGNTSWTTPSGGDSVEWTQLQSTGTKIAEIDINGTTTDVYVPTGGGGSGGHTIWNRIKTALTSRSNLWFADAKISDVSADDATKVEVLTELADETAFDNLPTDGTADGMYAFPDSGAEYLDASMVGYGSGTVENALDELSLEDYTSKISITVGTAHSSTVVYKYGKLLIVSLTVQNASISSTNNWTNVGTIDNSLSVKGTLSGSFNDKYFLGVNIYNNNIQVMPSSSFSNAWVHIYGVLAINS